MRDNITTPAHRVTRPETDGARYAREYLGGLSCQKMDSEIIADLINGGSLIACPVCHFLHLPTPPFPAEGALVNGETASASNCDVCRLVPSVSRRMFGGIQRDDECLTGAPADLVRLRMDRAEALFSLWTTASFAAETVCWDAMEQALSGLRDALGEKEGRSH